MSQESKKLLRLFRQLGEERRAALLEYAEFLASREERRSIALAAQPVPIPRPAEESVVRAIQRLMSTYPMLDRAKLFSEASTQMTRHILQGIPAIAVIDELEIIFRRHYELHAGQGAEAAPSSSETVSPE